MTWQGISTQASERSGDDEFVIKPPPKDDEDTETTTTTTGGSTSGGSSGGSSGPTDPYDAWYAKIGSIDAKRVSVFDQIYQSLWGEPAPLSVLQAAVEQGLNRWEFEEAQKKNPAWWNTEGAKEQAAPIDNYLVAMGIDPVYKRNHKKKGDKDKGHKPPGGKPPHLEPVPPNSPKNPKNPMDEMDN